MDHAVAQGVEASPLGQGEAELEDEAQGEGEREMQAMPPRRPEDRGEHGHRRRDEHEKG